MRESERANELRVVRWMSYGRLLLVKVREAGAVEVREAGALQVREARPHQVRQAGTVEVRQARASEVRQTDDLLWGTTHPNHCWVTG